MCSSKCRDEALLAVGSGLAVEGLEVVLDGVGGQVQAPGDLLDGTGLEEKVHHVELARGEPVAGCKTTATRSPPSRQAARQSQRPDRVRIRASWSARAPCWLRAAATASSTTYG